MTAIYWQTFVSTALHDEAERIQTGSASNMPRTKDLAGSGLYHYALGSWRESHFGIFAQDGRVGRATGQTSDIMENLFPIVREAAVVHHGNLNVTKPSTTSTKPILSSARLQCTELEDVVML